MNKKIILLESDVVMETNAEELIKKLKMVLQEALGLKIIITAKKKVPDIEVEELNVEENIRVESAYTIIKSKNPDWPISFNKYKKSHLSAKLKTPWLIIKAAHSIKK